MRSIRSIFLGLLLSCLLLLVGCNHWTRTGTETVKIMPSGYSCIAVNYKAGGEAGTAWAKHLMQAQKAALMRCRANSRHPNACHVHSCRWVKGAPIAMNGYFTCYVRNSDQYNVWGGTSQNEYVAIALALYRCQRLSHEPNSCRFSHCWLW